MYSDDSSNISRFKWRAEGHQGVVRGTARALAFLYFPTRLRSFDFGSTADLSRSEDHDGSVRFVFGEVFSIFLMASRGRI